MTVLDKGSLTLHVMDICVIAVLFCGIQCVCVCMHMYMCICMVFPMCALIINVYCMGWESEGRMEWRQEKRCGT